MAGGYQHLRHTHCFHPQNHTSMRGDTTQNTRAIQPLWCTDKEKECMSYTMWHSQDSGINCILLTAFYSNEVTPKLKALQHHKVIWWALYILIHMLATRGTELMWGVTAQPKFSGRFVNVFYPYLSVTPWRCIAEWWYSSTDSGQSDSTRD